MNAGGSSQFWANISTLKRAISAAGSPGSSQTYADELLTPEFGMGLEGCCGRGRACCRAFLNGVDPDVWGGPPIKQDCPRRQARYRGAPRQQLGLPERMARVCRGLAARTYQKGLDCWLDETCPGCWTRAVSWRCWDRAKPGLDQAFRARTQGTRMSPSAGVMTRRWHDS